MLTLNGIFKDKKFSNPPATTPLAPRHSPSTLGLPFENHKYATGSYDTVGKTVLADNVSWHGRLSICCEICQKYCLRSCVLSTFYHGFLVVIFVVIYHHLWSMCIFYFYLFHFFQSIDNVKSIPYVPFFHIFLRFFIATVIVHI